MPTAALAPVRDVTAATLLLVAGLAFVQVAARGRLMLHACTSADGPLSMLGVRFALLRSTADCPDGTFALVPGAPQGAIVVLSLALPVVAAHVALGTCGVGVTALLVRVAASAARLLRTVLRHLPHADSPAVLPDLVRAPAPVSSVGHRLRGALLAAHPRRGPPLRFA